MQYPLDSIAGQLPRALSGGAVAFIAAIALLLYITLPLLPLHVAEANGASTTIMDRVQGPYRVVVGIIPARPVVPQTHLAIQVFDVADEQLLRDTDVRLHVTASGPPGASDFGPRLVRNEQTFRYFEIDVDFSQIGPWEVSVSVESDRGRETFLLPLEVGEPGARIQWIWIVGLLVIILAVGAWTWLTLQRRRGIR